jgi:malate dehydrogenase
MNTALRALYLRHNSAGAAAPTPTPVQPITVAVTGANGSIAGYVISLIGSGKMLGEDQPVRLRLLSRDQNKLDGLADEVEDCLYKTVLDTTTHTDPYEAFKDADIVLGIGASPRKKGMGRQQMLASNVHTFIEQGTAFGQVAADGAQFVVVGNPTSGLAHIVSECAKPRMDADNVTAMHLLDQFRAQAAIAKKTGKPAQAVEGVVVFGNHSNTMYPYYGCATIEGQPAPSYLGSLAGNWNQKVFLPTVRTRGTAILEKRGGSSSQSAAQATVQHTRGLLTGNNCETFTMGVRSNGAYGIQEGVWSSFPVKIVGGKIQIIEGHAQDEFSQKMLRETNEDLKAEHAQASQYLRQHRL